MTKCIVWRNRDSKAVFRDLAGDYNTDIFTEEELNEFCAKWQSEDNEDGLNREFWVEDARISAEQEQEKGRKMTYKEFIEKANAEYDEYYAQHPVTDSQWPHYTYTINDAYKSVSHYMDTDEIVSVLNDVPEWGCDGVSEMVDALKDRKALHLNGGIFYDGVAYKPVGDAYINQDGNAEIRAIRADDMPDDMGAVDLYVLKYVLCDQEDFENGSEWYDNVDWGEPDGVDKTNYGWILAEGRIV